MPTAAELLRATLLGALASLRGDIALRARRASALAERTMQWAESADARTSSRARTRSAQASPTRRLPSRGGAAARSQLVARIAQWIVDCALLRPLRRTAVLLCVALAQLQRTQCGAARATRTHSIVVREKLALVLPVLVAWTSAAVRDAPGDRPGDGVRLACRWASLASRRVSVELHRTRIGHRDAVLSEWRVPRGDTADSRAAHDAALLSALVGAARSGTLSALHRTCAVRAEHRLAVWRAWAPRLRRVVERACSWIDGAVARSAGTAARTSAPGLRPSAGDAAGLVRVELVPGDEYACGVRVGVPMR